MKLTDWIDLRCIKVPLAAQDKVAAIAELVDLLHLQGKLTDRDAVLKAVLDREAQRPTGIEFGLAVPHGRCAGSPVPVMAVGLANPPINFGAADGLFASLIILLVGSADQSGSHIQALARISRIMLREDFRESISLARTAHEAFLVFARHESL